MIVPGFDLQGFPIAVRLQHPGAARVPLSLLCCRFATQPRRRVEAEGWLLHPTVAETGK